MITGIVVVIWALLGPMAASYSGCAAMGASCGSPCALPACLLPGLPTGAPFSVSFVPGERSEPPRMTVTEVPTPPPRLTPTTA